MTKHRATTARRTEVRRGDAASRVAPAGRRRRETMPHPVSLPVVTGAFTLVLAALGAAQSGTVTAAPAADLSSSTTVLAASSPVTSSSSAAASLRSAVLVDRGIQISRDSQREALGQATGSKLQAETSAIAKQRNAALAELASSAEKVASKLADSSWQLPLTSYTLTATFGEGSSLWVNRHTGLDFAAPTGTPVMAVTAGRITSAGYAGAYGNRLVLTDPQGTETWYCHLSAFAVRAGDQVNPGQVIAQVGATGNVTGPHLHLEVRPGGGDPVDPAQALIAHGQQP